MSTKNDLLATWVKWTGDPIQEARHRVRVLSEAGLLPNRAEQLGLQDIARALLGFLVSETHKEAAEAVRRFSGFRCISHDGAHHGELTSLSLLQVIVAALHEPLLIVEIEVSLTHAEVSLTIDDQAVAIKDTDDKQAYRGKYVFGAQAARFLRPAPLPIEVIRKTGFPLIRILTALVLESARTTVDPETMMAAEAPPSNGHHANAQQAVVQPASASTEQPSDTDTHGQRPARGGLSFPRHSEGHSHASNPRKHRTRPS